MSNIIVTCEDNMDMMSRYQDKHFDLMIVDPPYGIGADNMTMGTNMNRKDKGQYNGESTATRLKKKNRLNQGSGKLKNRTLNNSDCSWDISPGPEYFKELFRVSKHQIIWGGNYFNLPPTRCYICWDKMQPWDNFSQFELAWTSFDKPAAMFRYSNTGGANKETKIHPTQKPVKLYSWILGKFAEKGWLIGDTHNGSNSIGVACHDLGFDLIACEKDINYFNEAKKRLEWHQRQQLITWEK